MKTIGDVTRDIKRQVLDLQRRLELDGSAVGRALQAIARQEPLEPRIGADDSAIDVLTRLTWLLHIREAAADTTNFVLSVMRNDLLSSGTMSIDELFVDLEASAATQSSRLPISNERLSASWYHSANAVGEVLARSGADLALLVAQPLAEWQGDSDRLDVSRRAAS
ncbi:MAG: hypothetical protein KC609_11590, partial [Myxococcales bacterium]|nr:hypothetical protein [Myxococcales bacterium]